MPLSTHSHCWGFLHPLVNLSDSNVRIKDLSKKRLICPSCYFFTQTLSRHPSSPATVSHGHMLNLIIASACIISNPLPSPPSLFAVHVLYIHCKYSSNLFRHSIYFNLNFYRFSSLTASIIIITQSLPFKYPRLPHLPFSVSDFLAKLQHWQNLNIHHTISIQYPNIQVHVQASEHSGVGMGLKGNHATRLTSCIVNSWVRT